MRVIVGFLSLVGLVVVGVFIAAVGLFALDEIKRKAAGDDFAPVVPPAAPESGDSTDNEETIQA